MPRPAPHGLRYTAARNALDLFRTSSTTVVKPVVDADHEESVDRLRFKFGGDGPSNNIDESRVVLILWEAHNERSLELQVFHIAALIILRQIAAASWIGRRS